MQKVSFFKILFTIEGHQYLGSPIGFEDVISTFTNNKVNEWLDESERLVDIASTQPHAVFSGVTHGFFEQIYLPFQNCSKYFMFRCLSRRLFTFEINTGQNGIDDDYRNVLSLEA